MDRKALIGLLSGITMVIATLVGVALVNTRQAEGAATPIRVAHDCAPGPRLSEPGYGVAAGEACTRS